MSRRSWYSEGEGGSQVHPRAILRTRLHRRMDELDAVRAILHGRHEQRRRIGRPLRATRPDLLRQIAIQIGERLEIALRMTRRDAGRARRGGTETRAPTR